MKLLRVISGLFVMATVGCASNGSDVSIPLEGTNTAVVRVSVATGTGKPKVSEDTVIVKTGQRVVWVGPQEFMIEFPQGTPFSRSKFSTDDAVINLVVPRNENARAENIKKTKYKYDVVVKGERLDPHMVVIEQ